MPEKEKSYYLDEFYLLRWEKVRGIKLFSLETG